MFCDELEIKVIAGKGGDGAATFRREKFIAKGGPDGGDGGKGGNVIFKASTHLNTLNHLARKKIYKAEHGQNGMRKNMFGKMGEDLVIEVPVGTIIHDTETEEILADLKKHNQKILVARGGKGGLGNVRFKTSIRQAPRFAETGEPGQEFNIKLELKLVADVGIIGLPSAGKSTLISVISNAKPKIAAYHFTTLAPNLGVVNLDRFGGSKKQSFLVADIPGLIEGASQGKGLGHQFLKHITRTNLLVHLLDGTSQTLAQDYKTIRKELKDFDKSLATKTEIVTINKIDMLTEEEILEKTGELKKASKSQKIFTISAIAHKNLKELIFEITKHLETIRAEQAKQEPEKVLPIIEPKLSPKFIIEDIESDKEKKIFHITGQRIEQIAIMTDIKNPEGLERMYYIFEKMGIQSAIQKKKAQFGDIIQIGEKRIPYRP